MFRISGVGCTLLDYIYSDIDFASEAIRPYLSQKAGDGGLEQGKLVFTADFERFAGKDCLSVLHEITRGKHPHAVNIGGPAAVSMINAVQLLDHARFSLHCVASVGNDEIGRTLADMLAKTSLPVRLIGKRGTTPFTYVLSDPLLHGGAGERTFLNNIGTAAALLPSDLDTSFFDADLVAFGGTALVPAIHDNLGELLARAKSAGAFTVVNTVYDFRNQDRDPSVRWPMGSGDDAYRHIDLLVSDREEALRLSGCTTVEAALDFFTSNGVGAAVVTDGINNIKASAISDRFGQHGTFSLPVCASIVAELQLNPELKGDTTGCGDNFAGGLITSIAQQLEGGAGSIDMEQAIALAAACGGLACYHMGGVFHERFRREKRRRLQAHVETYLAAIEAQR